MSLTVVNQNGKFLVDSRDVAEMTEKEHSNLMRDIRGYVAILENSKLNSQDFFIPATYKVKGNSKTYDRFDLTRKGCDMVANKMTGEKGVLFTATYVTKFEEMEKRQQENVEVLDERKQRIVLMKTMIDHDARLETVEERMQQIEAKVDEQITLDSGEQRKIQKAIARKVYMIEEEPEVRSQLFRQLHREIKDRWAVPSYKDVRRTEMTGLLEYIEAWRPVAA